MYEYLIIRVHPNHLIVGSMKSLPKAKKWLQEMADQICSESPDLTNSGVLTRDDLVGEDYYKALYVLESLQALAPQYDNNALEAMLEIVDEGIYDGFEAGPLYIIIRIQKLD